LSIHPFEDGKACWLVMRFDSIVKVTSRNCW
jgi:hypothetical protein